MPNNMKENLPLPKEKREIIQEVSSYPPVPKDVTKLGVKDISPDLSKQIIEVNVPKSEASFENYSPVSEGSRVDDANSWNRLFKKREEQMIKLKQAA